MPAPARPVGRILVTGASGFVGGHLLPALHAAFPDAAVIPAGFDVTDAASVRDGVAEARPDACVHLAAISAMPAAQADPDLAWRINLGGTLTLARALAAVPGCTLVFASTADAYGHSFKRGVTLDETAALNPMNTYGATKAAADLALGAMAREGLHILRVRPFNHTGPGQSADFVVAAFARQVARIAAGLQPPSLSTGALDPLRDFLDVRDVCRAYALCLQHRDALASGAVLNIASGQPRRVGDVLAELLALAGVAGRGQRPTRPGCARPTSRSPPATRRWPGSVLGWSPRDPLGADADRHAGRLAHPGRVGARLSTLPTLNLVLAVGLVGFAGWAVVATGRGMLAAGAGALHALWLLPALVPLHLFQLLLSSRAWGCLLPDALPVLRLYRLRLIREGINSLLPVAQVGGEVVGARLLAVGGPTLAVAAASVVVDVTVEFLTQLVFLAAGLAALVAITGEAAVAGWLGAAMLTAAAAAALLAAQRFGVLRLLEALARKIAARWPGAASLSGMDEAAAAMYRRTGALAGSAALHLLAWVLGSVESWAVLHTFGCPVTPAEALVIESLGMAARSAGFAVPGALVVQETGFALAAAAVGLAGSVRAIPLARQARAGGVGRAGWARTLVGRATKVIIMS